MRRSLIMSPFTLLLAILSAFLPFASALRYIESNSLNPCMTNSSFSATLFHVIFTPDNGTLSVSINGVSQISGYVKVELQVLGYGYSIYHDTIDPCSDSTLKGLCPMNTGQLNFPTNAQIPKDTVNKVPNAIYYIPDLDGRVRVWINSTEGVPLACVEAELGNGKTVYQKGVAWTVAVIAGLGLVISAITSGLGHSNTAAHVASNALSLFGFFQAQAFIGMTAVTTPPIVRMWTQNFQWSMGIIRVSFLQRMATWYQRATGGTPSRLLSTLATTSVQVQKRSLDVANFLAKRTNSQTTNAENLKTLSVKGIRRVGFVARIEPTNIFFTGYIFFIIFVLLVVLGVVAFKYICEALTKSGKMKQDKFQDFRNGWTLVLKGILFRIVLIGFPQMVVLCFWEMTIHDSAAEVVLAVSTILAMIAILGWAALKVWRIARRSIVMHKNPAYILYSDPKALNKWGFLYVQFKATMYYFIVPVLFYLLIKGMFIAFGQGSGTAQAVALLIIEAAMLIAVSVMRPYMDKKTNAFNIAIAALNFFNVVLLLFFSGIFGLPTLAVGIMGVLFFVVNAVFALVILLMVMWASVWAITSKNPDTRYQPMRDDRGSFIKSQTNLGTTELDALGATARGDKAGGAGFTERKRMDLDDEEDSFSSTSQVGQRGTGGWVPPRSPVEPPSAPMLRNDVNGAASPIFRSQSPAQAGGVAAPYRPGSGQNGAAAFRAQNNASPWQRGVGY
ncbi:TRP-domain-containing protein [Trichodelitschia bisporula]|uniref:TRP-domain-containing protein n=1 Tax=Trichodelitschia bisporula TaxID=703511 RepID=A0A6G1HTS4_9PEZI|nr:TRP-domain-containing protein [Trichodelitschia bisporula]